MLFQSVMYLAVRKCKNDCKILKNYSGADFCPLKPEIARFFSGFRLNLSISIEKEDYYVAARSHQNFLCVLKSILHVRAGIY